ncbi:hypothetical protein ACTG2R_16555 [Aeromonas hydrophila]|uniref:hypothetical protein n=1 Tax=Aeromonas hydrophila TaxID=644 RepID=UPI003F7A376E
MSDEQGWAGVWAGNYQEVWVGHNQWVMEFSWMNLLGAVVLLGMGPGFALFLTLKMLWEHQQQLRRVRIPTHGDRSITFMPITQ